jgi:hypothetical protein
MRLVNFEQSKTHKTIWVNPDTVTYVLDDAPRGSWLGQVHGPPIHVTDPLDDVCHALVAAREGQLS